ncbi:MAG TPA: CrcB family protein [Gaiellaceae bacterium]|nr:CrcB family protein [Gaiellaceae bacterium]
MPIVLGVALGGALGASARYGADRLISTHSTFPWSTFAVNVLGCFLIGVCSQELGDAPEWLRLGVIVGGIGGFTTFSTFAYQALENHAAVAAVYVTASVGLGIAAVAAGRAL